MMMSLRFIAIVSTFAMGIVVSATDDIGDVRRVLLNHMSIDQVHQCTDMEWDWMDGVLKASMIMGMKSDNGVVPATGRRYLRYFGFKQPAPPIVDPEVGDLTGTKLSRCKKLCEGYAADKCPHPGCTNSIPGANITRHLGFKEDREDAVSANTNDMDRDLQSSPITGTKPSRCKKLCVGYAPDFCPFPGCTNSIGANHTTRHLGVDRGDAVSANTNDENLANDLKYETDGMPLCNVKQIEFINEELKHLMHDKGFAPSCLDILKKTVRIMCDRGHDGDK